MHADMRKRLLLTFTQLLEMCERGGEGGVNACRYAEEATTNIHSTARDV